ncbi:MAG: hypothetical protein EP302_08455 [Bacteroidetes bacterium]|jgi:hypothetical protein|nr:MAG: hypothetical protein EP302_08455 [Bacteroidota bacterium]UCE68838.1 MAG: hypothetical protein JSW57_10405 [Flavobacteriaceae bacterium]
MFFKTSHIILPAIKIYSLSANVYEPLIGLLSDMQFDHLELIYTLAFEGFFIFMKQAQIELPSWAEALQDLF